MAPPPQRTPQSYGRRIAELAASEPDRIALVCEEGGWTRRDLDRRANQLARVYAAHGLGERDRATLMLPNGLEFFAACLAIWRLGAVPNPLSHRLPAPERRAIIERAQPALIIGVDTNNTNNTDDTDEAEGIESIPEGFDPGLSVSTAPLPDLTSPNERAMASGGSTGLPKLIVAANPAVYDESFASALFKAKRAVLVPGPLYHAAPWSAAWQGLFAGCMVRSGHIVYRSPGTSFTPKGCLGWKPTQQSNVNSSTVTTRVASGR